METIHVPGPPAHAFNKRRPISDLIKAQIAHLKHLEEKLAPTDREALPQHRIITEEDAALYIAAMTRFLCAQGGTAAEAAKPATKQPKKKSAAPKAAPAKGPAARARATRSSR